MILQEASEKETGNKISSMVLIVEFLIAKPVIFTLGQWKKAKETEEEGFTTLNEMKFTMEISK